MCCSCSKESSGIKETARPLPGGRSNGQTHCPKISIISDKLVSWFHKNSQTEQTMLFYGKTVQQWLYSCHIHCLLMSPMQALLVSLQQRIITSRLLPASQIIMITAMRRCKQLVKTVSHLLLSEFITCTRPDPVRGINTTKQRMIKLRFGFGFHQHHSAPRTQEVGVAFGGRACARCFHLFGCIRGGSQRDARCVLCFTRNYGAVRRCGSLSGEVAVVSLPALSEAGPRVAPV